MKAIRLGLRGRFIAAILVTVSLSTAGFYYAVAQFIEFYESEMIDRLLLDELQLFADQYRHDPTATPPQTSDLKSHVVSGDQLEKLPPELRGLGPGRHEDVIIDGREVVAARQDVDGSRLYLAMDIQRVEDLEARFVTLAWICAVISWTVAVLVALWLSRLVLRPVSQLATRVGQLQPSQPHAPLAGEFGDHEIGLIAAAFDRYMARLAEFVGREQAFTEDASHELRTPLAVIHSSAQLLAEERELSALNHERVQRILRGTQQMQSLIEALLFLAREVGGAPAEDLALDRLVQEAADAQREAIAQKSLGLRIEAQPCSVRAPRGMVACIVNNLLLNAIHYTERGCIDLRVEPGRFTVQDSGSGIPPEDLERIFERRYRGSQSRGLGLGLYLVKRICDRLGWEVRVSSAAGTGTRFEVRFSPA